MKPNQRWVKLGCILLRTLLANPEGIRFLTEDKLLSQMADCFNDIDEVQLMCTLSRELPLLTI